MTGSALEPQDSPNLKGYPLSTSRLRGAPAPAGRTRTRHSLPSGCFEHHVERALGRAPDMGEAAGPDHLRQPPFACLRA